MKIKIFSVILILGLLSIFNSYKVYAEKQNNVIIPAGTIINGILVTPVSSKVNRVGDSVIFKTEKNLTMNGIIIIPKGTIGRAVVTKAQKAGY